MLPTPLSFLASSSIHWRQSLGFVAPLRLIFEDIGAKRGYYISKSPNTIKNVQCRFDNFIEPKQSTTVTKHTALTLYVSHRSVRAKTPTSRTSWIRGTLQWEETWRNLTNPSTRRSTFTYIILSSTVDVAMKSTKSKFLTVVRAENVKQVNYENGQGSGHNLESVALHRASF